MLKTSRHFLNLITISLVCVLNTLCVYSQEADSQIIETKILGKTGSDITLTKSELNAWSSIQTTHPDATVLEFDLESKNPLTQFHSNSNKLTKDMKDFISNNKRLTYLYIDKFKVLMPDSTIRQTPNITIKIVR